MMFRRAMSALSLLALLSAPAVSRTRMLCRFTGLEISGCSEQAIPERAEIQIEGCCDRQYTPALASARAAQAHEVAPPSLLALPQQPAPARERPRFAAAPRTVAQTGPPLLRITRALLI